MVAGESGPQGCSLYTEGLDQDAVWELVSSFSLGDEIIHRGSLGIYWGKYSEETYTKTAYHKQVLKMPDYRLLTIRNANTFDKIGQLFKEIIKEICNDIISKNQ